MNQIELLRARDPVVWQGVLKEHSPRLIGYATRMMGNRSDAEDVVQRALIGVLDTIERFEGRCSIKSWLFRAVHNRAIDTLREKRRWVMQNDEAIDEGWFDPKGHWIQSSSDWEGSLDARLDAKAMLKLVHELIDALPHQYREVILLKDVQQLETAHISEILDISPGNLRIRLHRARKVLRASVDTALGGI